MNSTQPEGGISTSAPHFSFTKNFLHNVSQLHKTLWVAAILTLLLTTTAVVNFYSRDTKDAAVEQYTLVADKISRSAPIAIMLPDGTEFANFDPATSIVFSPEIKGAWEKSDAIGDKTSKVYRFLPTEKLAIGAYYLATLTTPELMMEKMFSVDTDPSVLAVFPRQEAEANEYSNITIMFSRPMVPLSTLSENADIAPPVAISPKTTGRYKWITTRTLQFIPEKRLLRSSKYTIQIQDGFTSLDGVVVPAFTRTFSTRSLRYLSPTGNERRQSLLTHGEPLRIYFNQPIDLEKSRALISVTSSTSSIPVSFVASYGTRQIVNEESGKMETLTDRSVLEIFSKNDRHGRQYLWDFDENYAVTISGAVPEEGDIGLTTSSNNAIKIFPIIESVEALSPRSPLVTPLYFDPTGTLSIRTSEPIDLKASDITGKGIRLVAYGEKCADAEVGEEVQMNGRDCKKADDQKNILISFNALEFGLGETFTVTIKKLVNTDGTVLNTSPLPQEIKTFPEFKIVSSTPEEGSKKGSIKSMRICSTNPLAAPLEKEFYQKVRSNMMIGLWSWDASFLVSPNPYADVDTCPANTFQTTIRYGLVPKFAYEMTLELNDHFGQQLTKTTRFTTEDADPMAKSFAHLQPSVVMTPKERTTLTYGLDFMNEMDMTICKVTPEAMLHLRVFPKEITSDASTLNCIERKTARLTLPESYATRKYLKVDIKDYYPNATGNYVFVFSNPDYRQVSEEWDPETQRSVGVRGAQMFEKTYVTVTSLAIGAKQVRRGADEYYRGENTIPDSFMNDRWPTNLYWVNDFKTLTPSTGAVVTQYKKENDTLRALGFGIANKEGIVEMASADDIVGAVVAINGDSALVSNNSDTLTYTAGAGAARREYVYTDRPIYRPGDIVHIKGISRIGYDAEFEVPTGSTTLTVRNARYETARTEELVFNKNGTYEMTLTLDREAPLGYYSVETKTGGYASFQVEAYVAPQFKVELSPDKKEYISGEKAVINIAAQYYFGVPVQSGEVEYRIVAQDYYFSRYEDGYFSFGNSWYENENGWYGDRFVTSGKMKLSLLGKNVLTQDLNLDKLFAGNYKNKSKVLSVYVTVKNENGQSVTKQESFIVHRGNFYAGLVMDDYFSTVGQKSVVRIKTVDTAGKSVKKDDLVLILEKVDWKSYKRQEVDGNFYYRTERTKTEVRRTTISTDKSGNGSHELYPEETGEYELTITGVDDLGNSISAQYVFYVSGQTAINIRPTNNATLELVAEKTDLAVGAEGSFVVKSPYAKAKALITLARGSTYEHKVMDLDSQLTKYTFTATEQFIPNVVASVLLLSPLPEVKYGEVYYSVGTKEKELSVVVTPSKKKYLPGEEVTLGVEVKDSKGNPVAAEISLAVVDMSVLALVGNQKKTPVTFFYNGEPLTISTAINVKNVLNVAEIPLGTKGGGSGGDGLEKKKRGVFRDTAHWSGTVETDATGKATATFTLPDNLTEWQVESVGVTKDTRIGVGYSEFISRKTVMVVPLQPRFILPGDSFAIGGTIFNESDEVQKLNISVTSPTLTLTGSDKTTVTLSPHTSMSISFPATAPPSVVEGKHAFTLLAKNAAYEDVVLGSFPIVRNDTYESTATAGRITDEKWTEQLYLPKNVIADRGSLTLSLSATMATILDGAVREMFFYPYQCSEQVASKLRTIAIVTQHEQLFKNAVSVLPERITIGGEDLTLSEVVERGLAKLYQNQGPDGGMALYPNQPPSFWVTLSTLETFIDLKRAGYKVDEVKLGLSAEYVYNHINYPQTNILDGAEDTIVASYVLSRLEDKKRWESAAVRERLVGYANNKALVQNGLSARALAYLSILSDQKKFGILVTNRLFAEFENRSSIDARGTIVKESSHAPSAFFENTIVNTALALKAFSETERDTPLLLGYVRAIKKSRSQSGSWASTYNNITVISAMTAYLRFTNEASANMTISAMLDGDVLLGAEFGKTNIFGIYATTVPMHMLKKGESQAITFFKKNLGLLNNAYYYDILLKYYLPTETIPPRDEGFSVRRELYAQGDVKFENPVYTALQGEVLRGRVLLSVPKTRFNVAIEDFIPAGFEIVNQRFATEDPNLGQENIETQVSQMNNDIGQENPWWSRSLGGIFSESKKARGPNKEIDGIMSDAMYGNKNTTLRTLYPTAVENHDDRIFAFISQLDEGEYVYEYFVRALVPGTYQHLPLLVSELYTPENFGRTRGSSFTITKKVE